MAGGHDQRGQGHPQAITASTTNTTATVMASGDDHQYEDIDNPRGKTGQGQPQAITEFTTNTKAIVLPSGDDHQYENIDKPIVKAGQGQSQANTEINTNTTAIGMTSGHDQIWQGQSQAVTESLDVKNRSYGTGRTASKLNSLYKTANVITSGQEQSGQGQSQAKTESNTNTTATGMTSGNDQTGQGQSQAITESNTSTTSTVMTSGHDNIGQGQSQANAQSPTVANLSRNKVLAALQPNTMNVKTPLKHEASTEMVSGHDQTGQDQSRAKIQSLKVGILSHNEVLAALQPNPMYVDVKTPPKNEASTEMVSGHDQTGQDQSKAKIQSLKLGNLSHNEVLAALQPNPMYVDVKTPPKNEASTEMVSGHDQTGQDQSKAKIQSLKGGNLSHNEVLAALQPNPMYVDVKTPPKNEASTEMVSGHDQTGQDQSKAKIQSLKGGNLSHNKVLAALQPNPMYVDVKTPPKNEASTEMVSGHDQTGQDQSKAKIQSLKGGNLSHNKVLAALQPNTMYVDVKTPTKDKASTKMVSGHEHTGQDQSQAKIQSLKVGSLSYNEVIAALQPNTMYVDVKTPTKDKASTKMVSGHDHTG
ncbi:Bax inhibitor 1 [Branchiostoma belcheri]|nr:Bax inhibitor 1 [Branchiostoma belcheri]